MIKFHYATVILKNVLVCHIKLLKYILLSVMFYVYIGMYSKKGVFFLTEFIASKTPKEEHIYKENYY